MYFKKAMALMMLGAAFIGTSFSAEHKINLELRADYQSVDNDFSKTGSRGDNRFINKYSRLKLTGPTGVEGQSYVFRYNFAKNSTAGTKDGASEALEYAYISQKLIGGLGLVFGKLFTNSGSNEWWYSGADIYTYSTYGYSSELWNEGYDGGIELNWSGMNQWLALQILNPYKANSEVNSRKSWTLFYRGNLMDGMVIPSFNYGSFADDNATTDKHLGVGVQLNPNMFTVELEYNSSKEEFQGTGNKDVEGTSLVGLVRYNHDHFRPFVKYISEEAEDKGTNGDKVEKTVLEAGLEWYPTKGANGRWHIVYSSEDFDCTSGNAGGTSCKVNEKVSSATVDHTKSTIRIGWKFQTDIF